MSDHDQVRVVGVRSIGQLPGQFAREYLGPGPDAIVIGVGFGGPQPSAAVPLSARVLVADFTDRVAVEPARGPFDGDHDQCGALLPGEMYRLGECLPRTGCVVVADQDSPEHASSVLGPASLRQGRQPGRRFA